TARARSLRRDASVRKTRRSGARLCPHAAARSGHLAETAASPRRRRRTGAGGAGRSRCTRSTAARMRRARTPRRRRGFARRERAPRCDAVWEWPPLDPLQLARLQSPRALAIELRDRLHEAPIAVDVVIGAGERTVDQPRARFLDRGGDLVLVHV